MIVPKKVSATLLLLVVTICLFLFSRAFGQWLSAIFVKSGPYIPYTTHIVLFQFKADISLIAIKDITSRFAALRKSCVHPNSRSPYIISISGGKDISIENLQNQMSHAFVLQFYSNEDRDYYVNEDPAHQAFKDAASAVVEKTLVVDFQDGIFTKTE